MDLHELGNTSYRATPSRDLVASRVIMKITGLCEATAATSTDVRTADRTTDIRLSFGEVPIHKYEL